ncbi:MAG: acyltransferase [Planctomycetaceae bacterium]|nr:acyltransferase [Planctomycetaceae bacterium]
MSETVTKVPPKQSSSLKELVKAWVRFLALVAVLPILISFRLSAAVVGRNRALESSTQLLSLFPGITGQYLRRAFLQRALAKCHHSALVEFGTLFSQAGAILEENVYVGPRCQLGLVYLERDVLLASGVQIPSGGKTHYYDDPDKPIREQGGERRVVTIGAGAWIGTGVIVLADVGKGTIVAAGAVVTKPLPENVIAAGIPAKVIRKRFEKSPESPMLGEVIPSSSAE